MAQLNGPRAHLRPAVIVALGTGMRLSEQLQIKRHQVERRRRSKLSLLEAGHYPNYFIGMSSLFSLSQLPPVCDPVAEIISY